MSSPLLPSPLDYSTPEELLQVLLDVSPSCVMLFRPVYAPDAPEEIVDLAYVRLNLVAQRALQLPECPDGTLLTRYPSVGESGLLAFYRTTFQSGQLGHYDVAYAQDDKPDNNFQLTARRSGSLLVVSFTDIADLERQAVEEALRQRLAREQATRAETQRQRLHDILLQLPAAISLYHGPTHIYELVSPAYQQMFPHRTLVGRAIREALPELDGHAYLDLLDDVYNTGVPYHGQEVRAWLDFTGQGKAEERYLNVFSQATRNEQGHITGILNFAYDVTAQVHARQQVQQLNEELAATNEEFQASNEELLASNAELFATQQQLQQLANALEARVRERTHAAVQAQAEAERHQRRLEQFFMQAPAAICVYDGPDFVYELVNPAYQQLFPGRTLLGRSILEVAPEIKSHAAWQILQRVYNTGRPHEEQDFLAPITRADNGIVEDRYFNFIYQARTNKDNQVDGVLAFGFEVTQKVLARQQARRSELEFQTLLESIPQMTWTHTPTGEITFCNGRWYEYTGLPLGENSAEDWHTVIHPDDAAPLRAAYAESLQSGEIFTQECRFRRSSDGMYRWHLSRAIPLRDEYGQIIHWVGTATDIDAQVEARREMERQREILHTLFMEAPAPIIILEGPNLVYQLVNPAYQRIFPGRDLAGKPLLEALPELAGSSILHTIAQVYQTGETAVAHELPLQLARYEGEPLETIYWNFTLQARRNAQGVIDGVVAFAYDITEQVKARQVVEASAQQTQALANKLVAANEGLGLTNDQLIRVNADLDNFIYTASHDLRAPITNIEGLLRMLQAQLLKSTPEVKAIVAPVLGMMDESVARFKRTLDHLSDVTKLQKEHTQPTSIVDVATVVEDVRQDLLPLLGQSAAQLAIEVTPGLHILFSTKNLRSVVYNLLSNALKYRHPDRTPQVRISCESADGYTVLIVQDNGLGLEPSQLPEVFTMFRRLHTHVAGTGIGLYMVKRMVENAGGKVTVASEPGIGTTFSVYFRQ